MNFSLRSSLRLLPLVAGLALGTTGCIVEAGFDDTLVVVDSGPAIAEVGVDTDASMATTPGDGTALFVETTSAGHWTIYTSCDTALTGSDCAFDVLISATDGFVSLDNVTGTDFGDSDRLTVQSDGTIRLTTVTSFDLNGVEFDADPGAVIEIDVLLDGAPAPAFVSWVNGGEFQQGAPTNPIDFAPLL